MPIYTNGSPGSSQIFTWSLRCPAGASGMEDNVGSACSSIQHWASTMSLKKDPLLNAATKAKLGEKAPGDLQPSQSAGLQSSAHCPPGHSEVTSPEQPRGRGQRGKAAGMHKCGPTKTVLRQVTLYRWLPAKTCCRHKLETRCLYPCRAQTPGIISPHQSLFPWAISDQDRCLFCSSFSKQAEKAA